MTRRFATVIAIMGLVLASAAQARSPSKPPSNSQMKAVVRRAEGSRDLWATVNICNTKRFRDVIGIRAQMPSLGFDAQLSMEFRIEYYSTRAHKFKPVRGTKMSVALGASRVGLHQSGVQVRFRPHAGHLRGMVRFEWRLGSKLIGHVSHSTSHGHPQADFADPPHYSARICVIA